MWHWHRYVIITAIMLGLLLSLFQSGPCSSTRSPTTQPSPEQGNTSGHRVLIFAQLKSLLDLVERDVLQPNNITYVRLDGGVAPKDRFAVVQRFNSDPTIDVMLLTTHVGGLGLNLTAADTVVFLEHDWNPTKDMQAMDRAHRLGQARTVNVYRVLTRGTIEERIMGLQRFKMDVAAAVVNTDNMSMDAMDTSQLLDMFQVRWCVLRGILHACCRTDVARNRGRMPRVARARPRAQARWVPRPPWRRWESFGTRTNTASFCKGGVGCHYAYIFVQNTSCTYGRLGWWGSTAADQSQQMRGYGARCAPAVYLVTRLGP